MKKYIIAAAIALLAAVGAFFGYRYLQEVYIPQKELDNAVKEQQRLYSEIRPPESKKTDTDDSEKESGDMLDKCKQVNDNTVGWICVPGTNIDYPVVQGEDNDFYLHHGLDGKENYGLGVPFLDYRCDGKFEGFNSVLYAHNMEGRQMFADVSLFKDSGFMESHSTGTLTVNDDIHEIEFFAYLTVPSNSPVYHTVFLNEQERSDYIDLIYNEAAYVQGISADDLKSSEELHLILLSTCTFEYDEARGVLAGVIR